MCDDVTSSFIRPYDLKAEHQSWSHIALAKYVLWETQFSVDYVSCRDKRPNVHICLSRLFIPRVSTYGK